MATSGSIDSGGYQGRVIRFSWETSSTSGNTRTISYSFTAVGGTSSQYYHHSEIFKINGTTVYTGASSHAVSTGTILKSGTMTINQDSTTTLTVEMSGGIYVTTNNINTTHSWTLDTLIVAPTINSLSVTSKTMESVTCSFTCSRADTWYYRTDASSGWTQGSTTGVTSGSFTISGLYPNTAYTVSFIARNWVNQSQGTYKDNMRTTDVTTYNKATFTTYPTSFNIGSNVPITYTNPSNSRVKLKIYVSRPLELVHESNYLTGGSYTWTNTSGLYQKTPDSNTLSITLVLVTEGTQNYTDFKEINALVTNSNPIFSNFEYGDINSTTLALTENDPSVLIKGYSKNQITISTSNKATAQNSATMSSYKVTQGTQTHTSSYSSTNPVVFPTNGYIVDNNTINVYAIDSRGNSTLVTKALSSGTKYIEYNDLTITSVTATRGNNGVGQSVTLTFNGKFWNNKFGTNTNAVTNHIKSAIYEYKETSASSWTTGTTTLTVTENGENYSYTGSIQGDLGASGFDVSKSYDIRVTITDELSTKSYSVILGSGSPAIAITKDNKVAIGQKYDTSVGGALQVNGDIKGNTFSGTATTSNYLKTPNTSGFQTNQYGNLQHQRNTSSDAWQFLNNAGTVKAEYVWETGVFKSNGLELNTKPINLYNNTTGTTGTVTLSQTAANFTYLEIFGYDSIISTYFSTKYYSPNGKILSFGSVGQATTNDFIRLNTKRLSVSGTSITVDNYSNVHIYTGTINAHSAGNNIYITRVDGYK